MRSEEIYKKFIHIIEHSPDLKKEQQLISYLRKQIEEINHFLETIFIYPQLSEYADQKFLAPFWDNVLDENLIAIGENVYAKTQENISSFKIIFGFYLFNKVDIENLEDSEQQNLIDLGMKYGSYHCFHLKLICLKKEYEKDPSMSLFNKIINLAKQGVDYGYPGYLLYARTCWEFSRTDTLLSGMGLMALFIAENLEKNSINIIHNAYFGKKGKLFKFEHIDEMIQAYLANSLLSKEKITQAQEVANSFFRY